MGFGKLCLFVIVRTVVCVRVCIKIQVVRWFFLEISQKWSRYDEYLKRSLVYTTLSKEVSRNRREIMHGFREIRGGQVCTL